MADCDLVPLVSVIVATKDRPRFLSLALDCYRQQTYPCRELIVVDNGRVYPADVEAVHAVGGRLLRVDPATPLGTKLNLGIEQARGSWCQKMDDDDWYGPDFLMRMMDAVLHHRSVVCRPVVAFLSPFLFFDLPQWQIRRSTGNNLPGATLLCARDNCQHRPFRPLHRDEDIWFLKDQVGAGAVALPVFSLESYLAVRHTGVSGDRGHTWVHQSDGRTLEHFLDERPLYRTPEELLPTWAVEAYERLGHRLDSATAK